MHKFSINAISRVILTRMAGGFAIFVVNGAPSHWRLLAFLAAGVLVLGATLLVLPPLDVSADVPTVVNMFSIFFNAGKSRKVKSKI